MMRARSPITMALMLSIAAIPAIAQAPKTTTASDAKKAVPVAVPKHSNASCCGEHVFSKQKELQEFLHSKRETLCGFDAINKMHMQPIQPIKPEAVPMLDKSTKPVPVPARPVPNAGPPAEAADKK